MSEHTQMALIIVALMLAMLTIMIVGVWQVDAMMGY